MFRYTIELDFKLSGQSLYFTQVDAADMSVGARLEITLTSPLVGKSPDGGQASFSEGTTITGTIVDKKKLP